MGDRSVVQQIYTKILEAISSDTRGKVICGKDSSEQVKDQSDDRNQQRNHFTRDRRQTISFITIKIKILFSTKPATEFVTSSHQVSF